MLTTDSTAGRRWLSIQEAAEHLGVRPKTVRSMIARGELTGYKLGTKLLRIDADELDACLQPIPNARSGRG